MTQQIAKSTGSDTLVEVLERTLDKGVVIAGDIQIDIADVKLLTINVRLLIASLDKAKEMGIDWWEHDSYLSSKVKEAEAEKERSRLEKKVGELEERLKVKEKE